jgi:TonB family protein
MRAAIATVLWLLGMLATRPASAADAEGCADLKLLPRLESCVIEECSARQHESFDTAAGNPAPLDANVNTLLYSCPASMDLPRVKRELDAEIHKAGFLNVAEDKTDPGNTVVTARKGSHWLRWGATSEDGVTSYSITLAASSGEKFKAEACAEPHVLSLQKNCEIVECASKSEDSVGMRTAQKEQTSVAGTVQTAMLSCSAIGPAQAFPMAEDELKRSGFEILFSDHEVPESGWLTGRAGKHWVELVSSPDGESTSYALTSVAAGEVISAPRFESRPAQAPTEIASAPVAPAPAAPESVIEVSERPVPVAVPMVPITPALGPAAPLVPPVAPAPVPAVSPVALPGPSFISPKPLVQAPIQASHDLIWSISGPVVINLLVDVNEDGSVSHAVLTGKITTNVLRLESAALEAVSHWRFEPARQDGHIVPAVKIPVQLHFQGRPWRY